MSADLFEVERDAWSVSGGRLGAAAEETAVSPRCHGSADWASHAALAHNSSSQIRGATSSGVGVTNVVEWSRICCAQSRLASSKQASRGMGDRTSIAPVAPVAPADLLMGQLIVPLLCSELPVRTIPPPRPTRPSQPCRPPAPQRRPAARSTSTSRVGRISQGAQLGQQAFESDGQRMALHVAAS